jgi:hypothetical protein
MKEGGDDNDDVVHDEEEGREIGGEDHVTD